MSTLADSAHAAFEPHASDPEVADAYVVNEVIRGNREIFEVIVRRYNQQLYRTGMAYLHDHTQTEDAMQTAYIKSYLNLRKFQGRSNFGTWLTRIMINECLMILRARKRTQSESLDHHQEAPDGESSAATAPELMMKEDVKAVLETAIQALPRNQRAVYLLREAQHLSTAETAECLGLSRSNVKVCLHRAREGLKTELMKSAAGAELFSYTAPLCTPMTARVMRAIEALAFGGADDQPALSPTVFR